MVVLKEDNVPPLKWTLGRVIRVHKGIDGRVRVADVRTASGILKRAVHRLAPLPIKQKHDEPNTTEAHETPIIEQRLKSRYEPSSPSTSIGDKPEQPPAKPVRRNLGSSIVTLLLTCLVLPMVRATSIQVEQFAPEPGIHFDNLGRINLITTDWRMVIYYNLDPYWTDFQSFQKGITALQHMCDKITQKTICSPIIKQFRLLEQELARDNELLRPKERNRRAKRGLINVVGNIASSLFGVLDSEYAEKMSKTISNVEGNEEYLLQLLKNQTSIIDSTINIMKRDQQAVKDNFLSMDNQFQQILNRIHENENETYQLRITQMFSSVSIQLFIVSSKLQRVQSSITDVIIDSQHGKIHPFLLSPEQLRRELAIIRNQLPPELQLPAQQGEVLTLYKLMTFKGGIASNYVIFEVTLPLVNPLSFNLFKVLPVPALINGTLAAIRTSTEFLAILPHGDQYYMLKEQELTQCLTISEEEILCHQLHPVYRRGSMSGMCEINLYNHLPITTECKVEMLENSQIWIQLHQTNKWIFGLRKPVTNSILCNNEVSSIQMNGSGILTLPAGCSLQQESLVIHAHHIYNQHKRLSYVKLAGNLNISTPRELIPIMQKTNEYNSRLNDLQDLQHQLTTHQIFKLPYQVNANHTHHLIIGYLGLSIIFVIIGYIVWKSSRTWCNNRSRIQSSPPVEQLSQNQPAFQIFDDTSV